MWISSGTAAQHGRQCCGTASACERHPGTAACTACVVWEGRVCVDGPPGVGHVCEGLDSEADLPPRMVRRGPVVGGPHAKCGVRLSGARVAASLR